MLTLQEINQLLSELNGWSLEGNSISKNFYFDNFKKAVEFVSRAAEKSDKNFDIIILNEVVKISINSPQGLEKKDFEIARVIEDAL